MRFIVEKEIEFDAGHRVPDHASKCFNPHGHRYKVVVGVSGPLQTEGSENGMVVDFGRIKSLLTLLVHDVFDHGFIVHAADGAMRRALTTFDNESSVRNQRRAKVIVVSWVPTAENMAKHVFDIMGTELDQDGVKVEYVKVYETPTSVALYPYGRDA